MRQLLVFIHLAGVIVWVGGMVFAHFFLRPVAPNNCHHRSACR